MKLKSCGRPVEILLVEDNPGDIRLTIEAFRDARVQNHLNIARDGAEALEYLHRSGAYLEATRPDLILLDLNLPKMDGREVLEIVKQDTMLCQIPVVILTTSQAEQDILKSYKLHANCFITKPVDLDQFFDVIASIESFWMTMVQLPENNGC